MRVLYDYQILYLQKYGGISRYYYELIKHLSNQYPKDSFEVMAVVSQNHYFRHQIPQRRLLKHGNRLLNDFAMKYQFIKENIEGRNIDIIHPTYYEPSYLSEKNITNRKLIVTVHDMTHELLIPENRELIKKKEELLEKSDGIIAVSEHTKQDMLQVYPKLNSKPIRVIHHGYRKLNKSIGYAPCNLPNEYILYVGKRDGYKEFNTLLESMKMISNRYLNLKAVCVGGGQFNNTEINTISHKGLSGRIIQLELPDLKLAEAYKGAICLVFPSKYEGFGMPILEAFANSCPVVLRRASCFPEIAGNAALYFDDNDQLCDQIEKLIENSALRKRMIKLGMNRLKNYSWTKAAKMTYDFYSEIIG